jgi:hypothetical protein
MATLTKARGDAVLKNLPDALQEELYQYLRRNTQEKALAWLATSHGIKTSARALTGFWQWYPRSAFLRNAESFASTLEKTIRKLPELKITGQQASEIAEVTFELQAAQDRDPELFLALQKGKANREKLRLESRRVALLEQKAAQADKAKEVNDDASLTEAEKLHRYRQIFGG